MKFAVPLIRAKAQAALINLRKLLPPSRSRDKAIDAAKTAIRNLTKSPPNSIGALLAVEGWVAAVYFFA
jgi:CRISP-associated protein Cas1